MKALLYPEFERLEMRDDLEVPRPGRGEVLLKVAAAGICGSELDAYRFRSPRRPPPLVMGHEFCGVAVAEGEGATGFVGRRFVANSLVSCGECRSCKRGNYHLCATRQLFGMNRPGAFAEYCSVPAEALIEWPEGLDASLACLAEPLGNGVHMVGLTKNRDAANVLVIGAGPIGLMAMVAFKELRGSAVVSCDLVPERRAVASKLGAKTVFDPREVELNSVMPEDGFDIVIEAVGTQRTKQMSLDALRPGGATVWIGLHDNEVTLLTFPITLAERAILGTYGASRSDMETAIDVMRRPGVDLSSWVHQFPLGEAVTAFERMLAAKGGDIKAVLIP